MVGVHAKPVVAAVQNEQVRWDLAIGALKGVAMRLSIYAASFVKDPIPTRVGGMQPYPAPRIGLRDIGFIEPIAQRRDLPISSRLTLLQASPLLCSEALWPAWAASRPWLAARSACSLASS